MINYFMSGIEQDGVSFIGIMAAFSDLYIHGEMQRIIAERCRKSICTRWKTFGRETERCRVYICTGILGSKPFVWRYYKGEPDLSGPYYGSHDDRIPG